MVRVRRGRAQREYNRKFQNNNINYDFIILLYLCIGPMGIVEIRSANRFSKNAKTVTFEHFFPSLSLSLSLSTIFLSPIYIRLCNNIIII